MTTIQHVKTWKPLNAAAHYVGNAPSSLQLVKGMNALLHGVLWRGTGNLLNVTNGYYGSADNDTFEYYVVFRYLNPPGNDNVINLGVDCQLWQEYDDTTVTATFEDGTSYSYNVGGTQVVCNDPPRGRRFFIAEEVAYNKHVSSTLCGYVKFTIANGLPAHFAAFTLPRTTTSLQGDSAPTASFDQVFHLRRDAFSPGQPLRGCSTYNSTNGSIGTVLNHQHHPKDDGDASNSTSLLYATSKCIFQYGHIHGLGLIKAGAAGYIDVFPMPIRVQGRALKTGNKRCTVAVVGRWDTGTKLKITSSVGAYEMAFTGSSATAALAEWSTLYIDPTGDELTIEAYVSSSAAVEIKTIAIFEDEYYA